MRACLRNRNHHDGLTDSFAIESSGHRIYNAISNGPVILVSVVIGGDIVIAFLKDRFDKQFNLLRGDDAQIRIYHSARFCLEHPCYLEDRSESASFARDPMIRRDNLMKHSHSVAK